ncbi:MAG: hypothetical protein WA885_24685 [Phormidesmis sp.]
MTSVMVPSKTSALKQGNLIGGDSEISSSDAISKALVLIGKMFGLLLLLALFALSLVVWVWIASFRSGWQFWDWAKEKKDAAISTSLFYGLIVLMISPIVIFFDWSQQVLPGWLKLPTDVPLRDYIEQQLDIDLGEGFPFSPKPEVSEVQTLLESEVTEDNL